MNKRRRYKAKARRKIARRLHNILSRAIPGFGVGCAIPRRHIYAKITITPEIIAESLLSPDQRKPISLIDSSR